MRHGYGGPRLLSLARILSLVQAGLLLYRLKDLHLVLTRLKVVDAYFCFPRTAQPTHPEHVMFDRRQAHQLKDDQSLLCLCFPAVLVNT